MVLIGPAALAFAFGYVVFRSRVQGVYFAIVTQALAMILSVFMVSQQQFTGGTNGITNFGEILGFRVGAATTQHGLYIATVIVLLLAYVFARYITRSRYGKLLIAVRDDEERVRFTGYNVALIKATVFAIAGAFAGVAGALFVPQTGIISPANLGVVPSIEMVLWVAVGGRGTIVGAAVGALLVSWARSYLSESYPDTWLFALGALFVGSVVLFPRGVAGLVIDAVERVQRLLNRRTESEPAAPQEATGALSGPQHPAPVAHAASGTLDPTETAAAAGRSMS
jgi:urea transport system permease protein